MRSVGKCDQHKRQAKLELCAAAYAEAGTCNDIEDSESLIPRRTGISDSTVTVPEGGIAGTCLHRSMTIILVGVMAVMVCASGIMQKVSEVGGAYKYNTSGAVIVTEALKLCIALTAFSLNMDTAAPVFDVVEALGLFAVAFFYAIMNNMMYAILLYIDPATMFLIHNMKIVFTALFLRWGMQRHMTSQQWCGIVGLTAGVCLSQADRFKTNGDVHALPANATVSIDDDGHGDGDGGGASAAAARLLFIGVGMAFTRAVVTAATNVSCESLLKRRAGALWWMNIQLYGFGVICNGVPLLLSHAGDDLRAEGFFHNYTGLVYAIVLLQSVAGVLVSLIFKYIDNVALLAADLIAMVALVVVSILYFGLPLSMFLVSGCVLIISSLALYYGKQLVCFNAWSSPASADSGGSTRRKSAAFDLQKDSHANECSAIDAMRPPACGPTDSSSSLAHIRAHTEETL